MLPVRGLSPALMGAQDNPFLFLANLNGSLAFRDKQGAGTLTGSGAVRYQAANGAVTNLDIDPLSSNGTFASVASTFGASVSSASFTGDVTRGFNGTSWKIGSSSGGGTKGISRLTAKAAKVTPGSPYTFSTYLYQEHVASLTVTLRIDYYSADGTVIGSAVSANLALAQFALTRLSLTFTPPTGVGIHSARWTVTFSATNTSEFLWLSGTQIEAGSAATPLVSGATGGVWVDPITGILGTAHNSPSVSQAVAWVEEGTTNLFTNPSAETNTTGFSAGTGVTLTRDTAYAFLGAASFKFVTDGVGGNQGAGNTFNGNMIPVTVGQPYTASLYARGSGTVYLRITERDASFANLGSFDSSSVTLTDQWQRIAVTRIVGGATATNINLSLNTLAAQAVSFWADAWQVEQKAYATSYCDGSLGTGYSWSGTAHASTSTRTGTILRALPDNRVNTVLGAVAAKFTRLGSVTGSPRIWETGSFGTANGDNISIGLSSPYTTVLTSGYTNASSGNAVKALAVVQGTWETVFGRWSSSDWGMATAGLPSETVGARTVAPLGVNQTTDNAMRFGGSNGVQYSNGLAGPFAIFKRPLTAREKAKLAATPLWTWNMFDAA